MKIVRKFLAGLLSVAMIISVIPATAGLWASAAGGETNLILSDECVEVSAGETFTITLSNREMSVISFTGGVAFDPEMVACTAITGTRESSPGNAYLYNSEGDRIKATITSTVETAAEFSAVGVAFVSSREITYQAGTLLTITFQALSTGPATFTLYEDSDGSNGYFSDEAATWTVGVGVTDVAIATLPSRREYVQGDELSTEGLTMTVTYDNGVTETIDRDFTLRGYEPYTVGNQTVSVGFGGHFDTFTVYVEQYLELLGISVHTLPSKTTFYTGDTFDATGLTIAADFGTTTRTISAGFTISEPDMSTAGTKTVTVTYQGKTATFDITVVRATLTKIAVTTLPAKTLYCVGDYLDTTGLVVTATYNSGRTEDVTADCTFTGYDATTVGEKTVTVTYGGKMTSFTVTVKEVLVTQLYVGDQPDKNSYYLGDVFDTTGLVIVAVYSNGDEDEVTKVCTYTGFSTDTVGQKIVTASFEGCTTSFTVHVYNTENLSPKGTAFADSVDYIFSGGVSVAANINDGSQDTRWQSAAAVTQDDPSFAGIVWEQAQTIGSLYITWSSAHPTESGFKMQISEDGETWVDTPFTSVRSIPNSNKPKYVADTITLTDRPTTRYIRVYCTDRDLLSGDYPTVIFEFETYGYAKLTDLVLSTPPEKTTYNMGEPLDTEGLTLTATYTYTGEVTIVSGYTVSGYDSAKAGTQTVAVTFGGFEVSFPVTVEEVTLTGVTLKSTPDKMVYDAGEELDTTGLVLTASYSDGSTADILSGYTVSGYDMTTVGVQTITVTYGEMTATFTITVNEVVEELEIKAITPSASEANVGTTITWTVETSGGEGALQYYFYAYKNGSQIKAVGWKGTNTYSLKLPSAGTYTIKAIVKDEQGNKAIVTDGQVVATSSLTVTAVKSAKTESCVLNSNTWTVSTSGGEGEMTYYYYIYKDGEQLKAAGWTSSSSYTHKFTASGTYTIKAIAKDGNGNTASLLGGEIVVGPSLKIDNIETAMDTAAILDTNTWTVTASGGVGELSYYYYLYRNGEQYKMVGWKTGENANTYSPKFVASGTYYIKAVVMDEAGNKIAVSGGHMVVASSLKATAIESANAELSKGSKNTWTVTTSGGSGTLSFYYYVYKDGETYKTVGYKTGDGANTLSLTLSSAGTYTVKVIAKDSNGTKATIEGGTVVVK